MARFHLRCHECGTTYSEDATRLTCAQCSRLQEPGGVTRGVLEVVLEELPAQWPEAAAGQEQPNEKVHSLREVRCAWLNPPPYTTRCGSIR